MKKIISVVLAVMLIAGVLFAVSFSATAAEKEYKVLYWSAETDYAGYADVVKDVFSDMDGVTVVSKTSGALTKEELNGVQLVYIVNFSVSQTSTEGQNMVNAAALLKDFVKKGGRVIMNGEWNSFAATGNATLSALAAAMGGNFTILDDYSLEQAMTFNTEEKPELTEKLGANFRPNAYAPIESTNADAVWVAKDKDGKVFVLDQKVEKGYITALADINWIYDGLTDADVKAAAAAFLKNAMVVAAENIEAVAEETAKKYTVTLNKQNGNGGSNDIVLKEGDVFPTVEVPTREGYTFGGYFSAADGKGVKYYNADGTGAAVYTANSDITLYALWIQEVNTEAPTSPKTGDNSHMGIWIAQIILSLWALSATLFAGKKKRVFDR